MQMCHVLLANTVAHFDGISLKKAYKYLGIEMDINSTADALLLVENIVNKRKEVFEKFKCL